MRPPTSLRAIALLPFLALASCEKSAGPPAPATLTPVVEVEVDVAGPSPTASVVRINSTRQEWNPGQPWEKRPPRRRRSLGAIVAPSRVLTTAEMVADATFIELESPDGVRLTPATVIAVDYEANLALLGPEDPESEFFADTVPLDVAEPAAPGDSLDVIQIEDNGTPIVTRGVIQSVDVVSNFLDGQFFLTYELKASMQSAASSFTLPVLRDGRFAGLLTSYDSKDQISDISATEIVSRFLKDAADGDYQGFPSLGIATAATDDAHFRKWLKLPDEVGGLYVAKVRADSPAGIAGMKVGDVITGIDGNDIDRLGYFEHELYGRVFWSHLIRGAKGAGEELSLSVLREGETVEITARLERRRIQDELVPAYTFGHPPNFLVKGGLVFQELTRPLLEAFGDEWESRAPLNLLDALSNPEAYEERADRIVFLAGVIATPATVGYEPLRNLIVTKVNGAPVRDMKSLIAAFDSVPSDGLHAIEFDDEEFSVYLDEVVSTAVDGELLQRGLTRLSRAESEPVPETPR